MDSGPLSGYRHPDRFYRFSAYLKNRFGCRVRKIPVDAGFSCPNRDQNRRGGCIYCSSEGFSGGDPAESPENQIQSGIKNARGADKYIIYFQSYTNTYAPVGKLREIYDLVYRFPDIVGMAIGTRPDCVNKEIIELISSYCRTCEVWVEYGMQTSNDNTLKRIKRGHTHGDFIKAVELTRKYPRTKICAHIIIGLPGEEKSNFIRTAEETARLALDGVKLHPLHVMKDTELAGMYNEGKVAVMSMDEYARAAAEFLEYLHPDTVIQRLSADCREGSLIAPGWLKNRSAVLERIKRIMEDENMRQGRLYCE